MWKIKEIGETITNVLLNLTPIECMVREATNDEKCAPNSQVLKELASSTYNLEDFSQLMSMLWYRIVREENWRHVYKGLLTMDYLLKNGSENVYNNLKDRMYRLERLINKKFIDEDKKDQTVNITHRAKEICELINNREKYENERDVAKIVRERMQGSQSMTNSTNKAHEDRTGTVKSTMRSITGKIENYIYKDAGRNDDKFDLDFDRFRSKITVRKGSIKLNEDKDDFGDFVSSTVDKDQSNAYNNNTNNGNFDNKMTSENNTIKATISSNVNLKPIDSKPPQSSIDDLLDLGTVSTKKNLVSNTNSSYLDQSLFNNNTLSNNQGFSTNNFNLNQNLDNSSHNFLNNNRPHNSNNNLFHNNNFNQNQPNQGQFNQNQPNQGQFNQNQPNQGQFNQLNQSLFNQNQSNQGQFNQNQPNQSLFNQNQINQGQFNQPNQGQFNQPNQGQFNQPNQGQFNQPNQGQFNQNQPNQGQFNQSLFNQNQINQGQFNQPNQGQFNQQTFNTQTNNSNMFSSNVSSISICSGSNKQQNFSTSKTSNAKIDSNNLIAANIDCFAKISQQNQSSNFIQNKIPSNLLTTIPTFQDSTPQTRLTNLSNTELGYNQSVIQKISYNQPYNAINNQQQNYGQFVANSNFNMTLHPNMMPSSINNPLDSMNMNRNFNQFNLR